MALTQCKECGHSVSDKAYECPNCGCPIKKKPDTFVNKAAKAYFTFYAILIGVGAIAILIFLSSL